MHPNESFPILDKIAAILTPKIFLPSGNNGVYVPILWYAIPVFIAFTILPFVVIVTVRPKEFFSDIKKLFLKAIGK